MYELKTDEKKGRSLFAVENVKAGAVVIDEEAYSQVVSQPFLEVGCSYCSKLATDSNIFALSPDDPARYCSMDCLRADNTLHNIEISSLKELKAQDFEGNDDSLRLIARIAALKFSEEMGIEKKSLDRDQRDVDSDTTSDESPFHPNIGKANKFQHILSLESVTSQMTEDDKDAVGQVAAMLHSVLNFPRTHDSSNEIELSDIVQLLYSIQCNAHRVLDSDNRPVALGLFPLTSMMNHNCLPNCAHYFVLEQGKSPRLVMRAIRDIQVGEELTYSYVKLYDTTKERQAKLKAAYGFSCDCDRCRRDSMSNNDTSRKLDLSADETMAGEYSDKNLHLLSSSNPLSEACISRLQAELSVCEQLLAASPQGGFTAYSKICSILESPDKEVENLNPSHPVLLQGYVLLCRAGIASVHQYAIDELNDENKFLNICSHICYYGLLASGLIFHFTEVDSMENASILLYVVHALRLCELTFLDLAESCSPSFTDLMSDILSRGGSDFIFNTNPFILRIHDEITEKLMKRTKLSGLNESDEIVIDDESPHHLLGRFCHDIITNIRGECNIELFNNHMNYLNLPDDTFLDMVYYCIDIRVEVENEVKRLKMLQEENERLERVELAKAALKNKKGRTGTVGNKKQAAALVTKDSGHSSVSKSSNIYESHEVIRLVSNRIQREFGAKKRIKP